MTTIFDRYDHHYHIPSLCNLFLPPSVSKSIQFKIVTIMARKKKTLPAVIKKKKDSANLSQSDIVTAFGQLLNMYKEEVNRNREMTAFINRHHEKFGKSLVPENVTVPVTLPEII